MALSLLDPARAVESFEADLDADPRSELGMAELLRSEITARGMAPRAATLDRVMRLCAPVTNLDREALETVCESLVRNGDLVLARGGQLAATPLRAIPVSDRARLVASLPTRDLSGALASDIGRQGTRREVAWNDAVHTLVEQLGGVAVTPAQWAGLDRAPIADESFLDRLDARLEWSGSQGATFDRGEPLEWRGWTVHDGEMRWRREAGGARLWMACGAYRRFYAWTEGDGAPGQSRFIELSADECDRAAYALARRFRLPMKAMVREEGGGHAVEVPGWLPRAEYRWLSLHAEVAGDRAGAGRWHVASGELSKVVEVLASRLGIVVEGG